MSPTPWTTLWSSLALPRLASFLIMSSSSTSSSLALLRKTVADAIRQPQAAFILFTVDNDQDMDTYLLAILKCLPLGGNDRETEGQLVFHRHYHLEYYVGKISRCHITLVSTRTKLRLCEYVDSDQEVDIVHLPSATRKREAEEEEEEEEEVSEVPPIRIKRPKVSDSQLRQVYAIVKHANCGESGNRPNMGKLKYLVKWTASAPAYVWEPETAIPDYRQILAYWHNINQQRPSYKWEGRDKAEIVWYKASVRAGRRSLPDLVTTIGRASS